MILVSKYGTRFEVARDGCAVGSPSCPNGENAVTAYELKRNGERRYSNLSVCLDRSKLTEEG